MNISDLNNKIYGNNGLRQGESANFIINSIEQEEFNINNAKNDNIEIYKEIKF